MHLRLLSWKFINKGKHPPGIESTVKYEWSLGTVILNCLGASPWNQNQTTPQTIGQS